MKAPTKPNGLIPMLVLMACVACVLLAYSLLTVKNRPTKILILNTGKATIDVYLANPRGPEVFAAEVAPLSAELCQILGPFGSRIAIYTKEHKLSELLWIDQAYIAEHSINDETTLVEVGGERSKLEGAEVTPVE